jgi:hypothetical protein
MNINPVSDSKIKIRYRYIWVMLNLAGLGLSLTGLFRCMNFFRVLARLTGKKGTYSNPVEEVRRLALAVHRMSARTIFRCKCLETSLVIWFLALKSGIACDLKIGTRISEGELLAHAWVELQQTVVSEQSGTGDSYIPFKQEMNSFIKTLR